MNSTKACYWIALGIFAIALNGEYRQGSFPALHRAADRAETILCHLVTHAEQTLAMVRILTDRSQPDPLASSRIEPRREAEIARIQAEVAGDMARQQMHEQAEALRQQVRDRVELDRDQIRAQVEAIRAQSGLRRYEIEQMRRQLRSQLHLARATNRHIRVVCPETGATVALESDPDAAGTGSAQPF